MMAYKVFNRLADRYDAWFESEMGRAVFPAEVKSVRQLLPTDLTGWVEVGVGTGRFAEALGIPEGVDPSRSMLEKAEKRDIETRQSVAEQLPYVDSSLNGILLVVTLCFLDDPELTIQEFKRVLKPGGKVLVGIVPGDSPWGRFYREKAKKGHPFYSMTRFYSCEETIQLMESAGFEFERAVTTLFSEPGGGAAGEQVQDGVVAGGGFVAMLFGLQEGELE
jgi:SAM-dependent methyltransferase